MNEEIKELEERFKNGDFDDNEAIDLLIHYSKIIDYLEKENEKLHHYKTLYQSLKRQKEELRDWLVEQEEKSWDEVSSTFGYVLEKVEELESVKKCIKKSF